MRKTLQLLCLCLLFSTKANAQLTNDNCYFEIEPVSFDINSADNKEDAGIPCKVKLINPTGSKVLGYTFDFFTPKGMKICYIDFNNLKRYPTTRSDKHHVFQWQFMETMEDGTSRYRVLCYPKPMAIENCTLNNDDYAIATIYYTAEKSDIYHPYMKVDKSKGQINSDLNVTYLNDANEISDFKTKATSSLAVVTDATAAEGSQEYVHTMGAEWGTVCLPMDVTGGTSCRSSGQHSDLSSENSSSMVYLPLPYKLQESVCPCSPGSSTRSRVYIPLGKTAEDAPDM